MNKAGDVYLSSHLEIYRVESGTGLILRVAGYGFIGSRDGSAATARFADIAGLAMDDSNTLYITDLKVLRKLSGGIVSTAASLEYASGVAIDESGNTYVAQTEKNNVVKVSSGAVVSIFGKCFSRRWLK